MEDINVEDQDFSNQMQRMQRRNDSFRIYDNNLPIQKSNSFSKIKDESEQVSPMTQDGAFPQMENDE